MDNSDKHGFVELLNSLSDYYQREKLAVMPIKIYFAALEAYSLDDIGNAVTKHLQDTKAGSFYPKASDLIRHLEGGEITADMMIGMARAADTPLGCLARIKIGSYDLSSGDPFYLRQRATECLMALPEWKERAGRGEYTDHEISVMLKYNVSPSAPLANGLAAPQAAGIAERATMIECSPRHKRFVEPAYDPNTQDAADIHPAVLAYLEKIK